LRVPHAGVADQGQILAELAGMLANESEQVLRPAFLLALDHERGRQRQAAGYGFPRPAGLDDVHQLAFVVAGAARHDGFTAAPEILDARLERRGLPQIERIDRLDVVMSVEQRARTAAVAVFPDHDRMPGGRANADVEAERAEILGEMLRRLPALVPIRRIGR